MRHAWGSTCTSSTFDDDKIKTGLQLSTILVSQKIDMLIHILSGDPGLGVHSYHICHIVLIPATVFAIEVASDIAVSQRILSSATMQREVSGLSKNSVWSAFEVDNKQSRQLLVSQWNWLFRSPRAPHYCCLWTLAHNCIAGSAWNSYKLKLLCVHRGAVISVTSACPVVLFV